jgi:hypothetical protein
MLEADLADGDFSQITQAITNALRPTTIVQQRLLGVPVGTSSEMSDLEEETLVDAEIDEASPPVEIGTRAANKSSPARSKKPRSPLVIDVDLNSPLSFNEFANQKSPKNDAKRYLTVAAWFKLHRSVDAITQDHVYTCFRAVGWQTAIADFDSPLRGLAKRQLVNRAGKGEYAINHLGIAEVDKLGNGDTD